MKLNFILSMSNITSGTLCDVNISPDEIDEHVRSESGACRTRPLPASVGGALFGYAAVGRPAVVPLAPLLPPPLATSRRHSTPLHSTTPPPLHHSPPPFVYAFVTLLNATSRHLLADHSCPNNRPIVKLYLTHTFFQDYFDREVI